MGSNLVPKTVVLWDLLALGRPGRPTMPRDFPQTPSKLRYPFGTHVWWVALVGYFLLNFHSTTFGLLKVTQGIMITRMFTSEARSSISQEPGQEPEQLSQDGQDKRVSRDSKAVTLCAMLFRYYLLYD